MYFLKSLSYLNPWMRLWCLPTYSGFIFYASYDTHFMYLLQMVQVFR